MLYVVTNSDPEWNAGWEPLIFEGRKFERSFEVPQQAARFFIGVTAAGQYYPVRRFDTAPSGARADQIDYIGESSADLVQIFKLSDPWRTFPSGAVKLSERNFEEYFAAVGLQLRLGFFGHQDTYSRLHGDINANRDFLFGNKEAAERIEGFADFSGNLPTESRAALAVSLLNLLREGARKSDPEHLSEAFSIYGSTISKVAERHDNDVESVSWLRQLAEIYNSVRKPRTCMNLAPGLSGRTEALGSLAYTEQLDGFLHVMTVCAQHHYVSEHLSNGENLPASLGNVADGANFIWANNPQFVRSFLELADEMNHAGGSTRVGKEVRKFTYQYCQNGMASHLSACLALDREGGGV